MTIVTGKVLSYQIDENKITVILRAKEKLQIHYYLKEGEKINIQLGDIYQVEGEFSYISRNTNFHLFNYRNYMKSKKVYWQCKAEKITKIRSNQNIFYQLKNNIKKRISRYQDYNYMELFLLGDKANVDDDILNSYQSNGISHLFAISGMHITLFTLILTKLLECLLKNRKVIFIIIFCFLSSYLFLADFSPSLVRSVCFYFVITLNKYFHLKFTSLEILFYLFWIFLFYNAYYIYNVGFLFSFFITFSLIACHKIINRGRNYLSRLLLTSIISFLVGIPLVIQNYFAINFLSPILNCLFVPFVSFFVFPITLLTFLFPFLNPIYSFIIFLLENLSLLLEKLSFATFYFMKLSNVVLVFYYLIILFVLRQVYKRKYYYIVVFILVLLFHFILPYLRNYPIITFIDIGQGDSILIQLPHNQANILIDTGGKLNFNNTKKIFPLSKNIVIPYLHSEGISKLDYIVLTHGDSDHLGEAEYLLEHFKIKKVLLNSGHHNLLEKNLIKIMNKRKISYNTINKANLNVKGNLFQFLNNSDSKNENEDSLILYTKLNSHNILLMGDAGEKSETYLINNYSFPSVDILKLGHHGSKYSSSSFFLKIVKPKYAIISCGRNNHFKHPHIETIERLKKQHIEYYRTDLQGMIKIFLKRRIEIQTVF